MVGLIIQLEMIAAAVLSLAGEFASCLVRLLCVGIFIAVLGSLLIAYFGQVNTTRREGQ